MSNHPSLEPNDDQRAKDAHARGDLATAIAAHQAHLAALDQSAAANPEAFLFHALLLFQDGRIPESLAVIDDGLRRFSDAPALHENRGVLLLTIGDNGGMSRPMLK